MTLRRSHPILLFPLVLAACGGAAAPARGAAAPSQAAQPQDAPLGGLVGDEVPTSPYQDAPAPAPEVAAPAAQAAPAPDAPPPAPWPDLAAAPGAPELEPGAKHVAAGAWIQARQKLGAAVEAMRGKAGLDAELAGQALLGRACRELGDAQCAQKQFSAVIDAWKDPKAALAAIEAAGGDEAARKQRVQRALLAVGEALFFAAEQKRKAADDVRLPAMKGGGSREEVQKHLTTQVAPWVQKKRPMLEEAERAYLKIFELAPAPPPRWAVDASSRVGMLWAKFTAEFRAAPIPAEWKRSGPVPGGGDLTYEEVRATFYSALDGVSEPMKQRARAAFQKCQADAKRFAHADEMSRHCDAWLDKNP